MIRDSSLEKIDEEKVVALGDGFVSHVFDLRVYKLAFETALAVHQATLEFPKIEQYALADQMRRASKSVCANLVEGFGKQAHSKAEFNRFLSIAIGSANEMLVWTDFARALGYIQNDQSLTWRDHFDHIAKMLPKN